GRCELVSNLPLRLPLWTISEMLGVPEERRHELWEAPNTMVGAQDPETLAQIPDPLTTVLTAAITLSTLGSEIAAERRAGPRAHLLTPLVPAVVDGQGLNAQEIGAFLAPLGVAGNVTPRTSISHGVMALAHLPAQWVLVPRDPE